MTYDSCFAIDNRSLADVPDVNYYAREALKYQYVQYRPQFVNRPHLPWLYERDISSKPKNR